MESSEGSMASASGIRAFTCFCGDWCHTAQFQNRRRLMREVQFMIKKDELADPTSCLNQSADDEPLFVLCARDPEAPYSVEHWADWYYSRHLRLNTLGAKQVAKWKSARALAELMREWRKAHQ